MSRVEPRDLWHKPSPGPGEERCRRCPRAVGPPSAAHGTGMRWEATWDTQVDGKRVRNRMRFTGYADALDQQEQMRRAVRDKSAPIPRSRAGSITLSGWFPRHLELTREKHGLGTADKLSTQFRTCIEPWLGDRDMAELQHDLAGIKEWTLQLRALKAPGTVENVFVLLGALFKTAAWDDTTGVFKNPCGNPQIRPPKAKRVKRKAGWTAEKVAALYLVQVPAAAQRGSRPVWDRYRAMPLLAATTGGMRHGEVAGLDPGDINWGRREITMNFSLVRTKGMLHWRPGKSDAAQRVMTAADLTLAALSEHIAKIPSISVALPMEDPEDNGRPIEEWEMVTRRLVFSTQEGHPVSGPVFQSAARWALNHATVGGVPLLPARPHESRVRRDAGTGQYTPAGRDPGRRQVGGRYEKPTDHGVHFHALRHFWPSLMESRGLPSPVIKEQVGHELWATLHGGKGFDILHDTYIHPMPGDDKAIRDIITAEFGPFLPGLVPPGAGAGERRLISVSRAAG